MTMNRFIVEVYISDGCTFSCTECIPVETDEYNTADDLKAALMYKIDENLKLDDRPGITIGKRDDVYLHYLKDHDGEYTFNVFTVDEWFKF